MSQRGHRYSWFEYGSTKRPFSSVSSSSDEGGSAREALSATLAPPSTFAGFSDLVLTPVSAVPASAGVVDVTGPWQLCLFPDDRRVDSSEELVDTFEFSSLVTCKLRIVNAN